MSRRYSRASNRPGRADQQVSQAVHRACCGILGVVVVSQDPEGDGEGRSSGRRARASDASASSGGPGNGSSSIVTPLGRTLTVYP
jgi:hypothetical protein